MRRLRLPHRAGRKPCGDGGDGIDGGGGGGSRLGDGGGGGDGGALRGALLAEYARKDRALAHFHRHGEFADDRGAALEDPFEGAGSGGSGGDAAAEEVPVDAEEAEEGSGGAARSAVDAPVPHLLLNAVLAAHVAAALAVTFALGGWAALRGLAVAAAATFGVLALANGAGALASGPRESMPFETSFRLLWRAFGLTAGH